MPGVPGRHDPNVTQRSRHENDLRRWDEVGTSVRRFPAQSLSPMHRRQNFSPHPAIALARDLRSSASMPTRAMPMMTSVKGQMYVRAVNMLRMMQTRLSEAEADAPSMMARRLRLGKPGRGQCPMCQPNAFNDGSNRTRELSLMPRPRINSGTG